MIQHIIKEYYKKLSLRKHILTETINFWIRLKKYNSSINAKNSKSKLEYNIIRESHTIEKGLSLRNPKKSFGQAKVLNLIQTITIYYEKYNDKIFLTNTLSIIEAYINYCKSNGVNIITIEKLFKALVSNIGEIYSSTRAGAFEITKDEIWSKSLIDFGSFVKSRHSVRYFSKETPSIDLVEKALEIAQYTPSACNRQSWQVHLFQGETNKALINWQAGANGFQDEIPMSILVTSNLNAFRISEPYQAYVDGGLFAMNVIHSLHSLGFGIIPLSTARYYEINDQLYKKFNISKNEVPIMIIGIGCLEDRFRVAASKRSKIKFITHKRD